MARHNPNALFLLTNPDTHANIAKVQGEEKMIPGAGCLGAFFKCFLGRDPEMSPGKPNPAFLSKLLGELEVKAEECLFVGDNLNTDIQLAVNAGTDSLCVLSGITNEQMLQDQPAVVPTYYSSHLFV